MDEYYSAKLYLKGGKRIELTTAGQTSFLLSYGDFLAPIDPCLPADMVIIKTTY